MSEQKKKNDKTVESTNLVVTDKKEQTEKETNTQPAVPKIKKEPKPRVFTTAKAVRESLLQDGGCTLKDGGLLHGPRFRSLTLRWFPARKGFKLEARNGQKSVVLKPGVHEALYDQPDTTFHLLEYPDKYNLTAADRERIKLEAREARKAETAAKRILRAKEREEAKAAEQAKREAAKGAPAAQDAGKCGPSDRAAAQVARPTPIAAHFSIAHKGADAGTASVAEGGEIAMDLTDNSIQPAQKGAIKKAITSYLNAGWENEKELKGDIKLIVKTA